MTMRLMMLVVLLMTGMRSIAFGEPVKPHKVLARVVQTIEAFNHPEAIAMSLDSKFIYVSNPGTTINGSPLGKGVISKLELQADGTLKMLKWNLVEGLNAPMGMAFLPKATKKFPAGSLFVATGFNDAIDDKGERITDIKKSNPGVTILDPETGQILGHIAMGPGTAAAKNLLHAVLAPNSVCFDAENNLYVSDAGFGGEELVPVVPSRPGIKRIKFASIDFYAENIERGDISFLPVRHIPYAMFYTKTDDDLYWSTSDGQGHTGCAVFRIPRKEFPAENIAIAVVGGEEEGPLQGIAATSNGTLLFGHQRGDIGVIDRKRVDSLRFEDESIQFSLPAQLLVVTMPNKTNILFVPDKELRGQPWRQKLRVVLLPEKM